MEKNRVFREILFSLIPGLGPIYSRRILEELGGLDSVFSSSIQDLSQIDGINVKGAEHILQSLDDKKKISKAREEIDYLERNQIKTFFLDNSDYPYRLKQCPDAPVILYFQGKDLMAYPRMLAIVGSRKASPAGKKITHDFLSELRNYGILCISGLAYGIDIQAHRSSLEFNIPTIGVLGHGLDNLYPAAHLATSKEMKLKGGLITEFISGTPLSPGLFPRRNRIIAGLCDALVVVEAAEKGGALITADLANSYDRDVFAFPGRVNDPNALGCLGLIRDQKAQLITKAEEFLRFMNWDLENQIIESKPSSNPLSTNRTQGDENKVFQFILHHVQTHLNQLEREFPEFGPKLFEILLELEMDGKIRSLPGKMYERV